MTEKQIGTARGMAIGALVSVVVIGLQYHFRVLVPAEASFLSDIRFVMRADIVLVLWLLAGIARIATVRFFSPQDIDGSGLTTPSAAVSVDRAVLQNTLEQLVLAQGAYFAMVAASHRTVVLIPALVLLFSVGRLLFWRGYERGAAHRACGFAMTFYPTIFACLVAVVAMV
ncbi:MAG: MAPEG family protein [Gluconacetobacter sp.]|uniref:MAPEG family protein n=1 Tax=Gluconacetobacter dulcium TaxID=2729096 RepID=A0A7W4PH95_9PROT|nr:MAPEG family protein [Gluconacetobacter dulcium]MBB2197500.1 MAPEG family protein [Gluconacetobacter dulcium]